MNLLLWLHVGCGGVVTWDAARCDIVRGCFSEVVLGKEGWNVLCGLFSGIFCAIYTR